MDENKFAANTPGWLVGIDNNRKAFVPDALPPDWEFPVQLWPILAEAKAKIGMLEGIGRSLPDAGILLRPIHDREALQSTRLEGTYITAREFLLHEIQRQVKTNEPGVDEWREAHNCRRALQQGVESELPLCLRLIRDLHKTLITNVRRGDMTPGEFRTHQVAIGSIGDPRFIPPPPQQMLTCLGELEKYIHAQSGFDPLVHSFLCHYQFETIHPFHDGNGRVGRLLLGLMIQQGCQLSKPWVFLSDILERRRIEYRDAMFDVSAKGDWNKWIEFCLRATIDQTVATIDRCENLRRVREELRHKAQAIGGHVRLLNIVDHVCQACYMTITDVQSLTSTTYPTAKSDCEKLVRAGILTQLNVSPMTFAAMDVFKIIYSGIGE